MGDRGRLDEALKRHMESYPRHRRHTLPSAMSTATAARTSSATGPARAPGGATRRMERGHTSSVTSTAGLRRYRWRQQGRHRVLDNVRRGLDEALDRRELGDALRLAGGSAGAGQREGRTWWCRVTCPRGPKGTVPAGFGTGEREERRAVEVRGQGEDREGPMGEIKE